MGITTLNSLMHYVPKWSNKTHFENVAANDINSLTELIFTDKTNLSKTYQQGNPYYFV